MRIQMLVVALAAASAVGCGSSGGGSSDSGSTNKIGTAFKSVGTALAGVSGMIANTSTNIAGPVMQTAPHAPSLLAVRNEGVKTGSNIWDGTSVGSTLWMADPRCSGGVNDPHCATGSVNLKYYMGFMFDADAVRDNGSDINVFGRVKSALKHGCAVAAVLGGGTMPAAGSYTITFNSALNATLKTYCFFTDSDLTGMSGAVATISVVDTTVTTYYDKIVTMTAGGESNSMYMRVNDTEVNFLAGEQSGSTNFSRIALSLNRTTNKLLAEYVSLGTSNGGAGEWHRLYYDPANSLGAVVGSSFDFQGSPDRIVYAVKGVPNSNTTPIAYSVGISGFGLTSAYPGSSTSSLNFFKACINPADGSVNADNTVTCGSITGHNVSSGGLATVFNNLVTDLGGVNGGHLTSATVVSESTTVPFTSATDIFTSAVPSAP